MNCEQARDFLLEVDPVELAGQGNSTLALHLASCDRCAARARAILAGQRALAAAFGTRGPSVPADQAFQAGRAAWALERRRRARRWQAVVPVALAASVAAVLLWPRAMSLPVPAAAPEAPLPPLAVDGPADRTLSVFQTGNPDIVVIWYF